MFDTKKLILKYGKPGPDLPTYDDMLRNVSTVYFILENSTYPGLIYKGFILVRQWETPNIWSSCAIVKDIIIRRVLQEILDKLYIPGPVEKVDEIIEITHKLEAEGLSDKEYKSFLKDAFGNKGIKSYVFEQVVNEINFKANDNLKYLFDSEIEIEFKVKDTKDTKGNFKHKFETNILYDGDVKEFGSFSGGEKRRIVLAVDLAISQIIQNRSSRSINLLIFDEYFSGLDYSGKEKMMELLKDIEGVTTLVIDHNTQFQNLFDYEIRVEKENGISKIV